MESCSQLVNPCFSRDEALLFIFFPIFLLLPECLFFYSDSTVVLPLPSCLAPLLHVVFYPCMQHCLARSSTACLHLHDSVCILFCLFSLPLHPVNDSSL